MKKVIYILTLLIITSYGCTKIDRDFTDNTVQFETVERVPIVQGTLNNKKVYYIIDSGASLSVLDESQSKTYKFNVFDNPDYGSGVGYGGIAKFKQALGVDAYIGGVKVNVIFRTQNLSILVDAIQRQNGIKIVGIVGCDWLKTNKIIIDFKDICLKK
jgi:hypothetical protein